MSRQQDAVIDRNRRRFQAGFLSIANGTCPAVVGRCCAVGGLQAEHFGQTVEFLGGFTAMFVVGLVLSRPWRLRGWLRSRSGRPA
jgi:hypothetical protein